MEGGRGETGLVDVGKGAGQAGVACLDEVCVLLGRVASVGGQEDEGVEGGAVVVDLALDAAVLGTAAVQVVPVAAGVAVPGPVGDGWGVAEDGV